MSDTYIHSRGVPSLMSVTPTSPPGGTVTGCNFRGVGGDTGKWIQSVTPDDLGTSCGPQQLLWGWKWDSRGRLTVKGGTFMFCSVCLYMV